MDLCTDLHVKFALIIEAICWPNLMGVSGGTGDKSEVHVKGLANIGNTCYFASAIQVNFGLQNLAQQLSNAKHPRKISTDFAFLSNKHAP